MTAETTDRFHALDAVRATALLLGIFFHASFSSFPGRQIWPVMDSQRSLLLADTAFGLHVFRMTTFFLLAGFFAHMSFHRRGLGGFVWDRFKRIVIPLVVCWPFVLASIIAISIWAAVQANGGVMPKSPAPATPPLSPSFFPLTHLWFLYVLILFYAATLVLRGLVVLIDWKGGLRRGLDKVAGFTVGLWAPVLLAAPLVAAFAVQPNWIAWFGVPTPDSSLIPSVPAVVAFGSAFSLGWFVHRQPALLEIWARRWLLNLLLGAVLIAVSLAIVGIEPSVQPIADRSRSLAYAVCYAMALWCSTFAVVGLALRFLSGRSAVRRWVADSSYWLYIVHLPIIMTLQVVVAPWALPWPAKLAVVLGVGLAIMWTSYQLLVRYSFIGWILNGPRPNPRKAAKAAAKAQAQELTA
jgi:peptidoglycan/LPS O-acetylase OafA/YrhL